MSYESDHLLYYLGLRNCSYSIILNYEESPSTPQFQLPRPVPTISPSGSSLASAPPWDIFHRWGGRPHFPLWLPDVYWCTILWDEVTWLLSLQPPGGIPTPRPSHVSPESLLSALPTVDETPPRPLASTPSPHISHCHIWVTTVSLPYTSSPWQYYKNSKTPLSYKVRH